jgi:hypothetical protein
VTLFQTRSARRTTMTRLLTKLISPAIAAALVGGLAIQMSSFAGGDRVNAAPFHAAVKAAVEAIPVRLGDWEGIDTAVPDAAGQLLRPNVLFARTYRHASGPEWAKLVIIHCKDTRDMSGHYPPNCYRGSGWTQQGEPVMHQCELWGRAVPIAEYRFTRSELRGTIDWRIYDFFILPGAGFVTNMVEIQNASGDYRTRPYGAAQIQVIVDADMPPAERERTLRAMLEPLGPVIDKLQLARTGARP